MKVRVAADYDLLKGYDRRSSGLLVATSHCDGDVELRQRHYDRGYGEAVRPEEMVLLDELAQRNASKLRSRFRRVVGGDRWRVPFELGDLFHAYFQRYPAALPIAGGAEIFPDESLDRLLGIQPRNGQAIVDDTFLGLFTSQTSTTVPARTVTLASQSGITEVANAGAYARVAITGADGTTTAANAVAGDWGAIATSGNGRRTTSAQKSFPESTASWSTVNGFFIASVSTHGGGIAFYYANFDDGQPIVINSAGYTVRVTPYWQVDG